MLQPALPNSLCPDQMEEMPAGNMNRIWQYDMSYRIVWMDCRPNAVTPGGHGLSFAWLLISFGLVTEPPPAAGAAPWPRALPPPTPLAHVTCEAGREHAGTKPFSFSC